MCSGSQVLNKMCTSGMKVRSKPLPPSHYWDVGPLTERQESQEGVIELTDDEPWVVEAMLFYLYHFEYSDEVGGVAGSQIVFHVRVHTIADKYDIPLLVQLAASKFSIAAKDQWSKSEFADAIREVYSEAADPNRELRQIILDTSLEHAKHLFATLLRPHI